MSETSANIIVDLDSLLDTRQGVLSKLMDEDELTAFLSSDAYILRDLDNFPTVDMESYNLLYASRDKSILPNSIVSYIFNIVKIKLNNLLKTCVHNSDIKEVNLLVNFYPYVLSREETDSIIDAIFQKLGSNAFIKPIYKSPAELTPMFLESMNIVDLFLYDTNAWCNSNLPLLKDHPMVKRNVYLPSLVTNPFTEEQTHKFKKFGFKDIHTLMEYSLSPYITLNYLPILFYGNVITVSAYLETIKDRIEK